MCFPLTTNLIVSGSPSISITGLGRYAWEPRVSCLVTLTSNSVASFFHFGTNLLYTFAIYTFHVDKISINNHVDILSTWTCKRKTPARKEAEQ